MTQRYTLADALHFLAEYETAERMFKGIDDVHCLEIQNQFAAKFNAAIKSIKELPIVTVRPASKNDTRLAMETITNMVNAENYATSN